MENNKENLFILNQIHHTLFSVIRFIEKYTITIACITFPIFYLFFFIHIPQLVFLPFISGVLFGVSVILFGLIGLVGDIISWRKPLIVKFQENGIDLLTKDQTSLVLHIPNNRNIQVMVWKTFASQKAVYLTFHNVNGDIQSFIYKYNNIRIYHGNIPVIDRFELFRIQLEKMGFDVNGIQESIYRTKKMGKIIFVYFITIVVVGTIVSKFL